jgi:hypothetical protein
MYVSSMKASLIVLADLPALVKWIKYTDTEVSEAGNVRVMLKDKQNLPKNVKCIIDLIFVFLSSLVTPVLIFPFTHTFYRNI